MKSIESIETLLINLTMVKDLQNLKFDILSRDCI